MKKCAWKKPELVILARSNLEEFVLGTCKNGVSFGGPQISYEYCLGDLPNCINCSVARLS
jgi:hypothetical protein